MPKIADVKGARADFVIHDEVPPGPRPVQADRPHVQADHVSFLNADGTRSRVCICTCLECWPADGRHCLDWNDDPEGV